MHNIVMHCLIQTELQSRRRTRERTQRSGLGAFVHNSNNRTLYLSIANREKKPTKGAPGVARSAAASTL